MATNQYNDSPADLETITAGALLYRILDADATYDANSFNMRPRPLGHPDQGRFEPTDPALGGYLYAATTVTGAVAEGILRNQPIPASRLVYRIWLTNKKIAFMRLGEEIEVAAVYGRHAAKLNLDTSLLCCDSGGYSRTRTTSTAILLNTPNARGLRYPCRNQDRETSLMLISRGATPDVRIEREMNILGDAEGRDLILRTLDAEFGLRYAGAMPR